jgi:hypothetical protein
MKFCTTLLIGTLTVCLSAAAQDTQGKLPESEIALLRADIQTKKTDILQQNLTLSDEQGKTFWPLQRSYQNDLSKLGDQRLEVIREYAKNWDNLTDETAKVCTENRDCRRGLREVGGRQGTQTCACADTSSLAALSK